MVAVSSALKREWQDSNTLTSGGLFFSLQEAEIVYISSSQLLAVRRANWVFCIYGCRGFCCTLATI